MLGPRRLRRGQPATHPPGRRHGAGRAEDAAAPGVARPPGRRARRARALRSALGLLPPRAPRRSGLRCLPALRARLPGGAAPPARGPRPAPRCRPDPSPGAAGRALVPIGPGPALVACPAPLDPGATSRPDRAVQERALGFVPRPSSWASGPPARWLAPGFLQQVPAFSGGPCRAAGELPGRSLQSHGHMAQQKNKGCPTVVARPASVPTSLRGQLQAPGLGSLEAQASVHGSQQAAP